VVLAFVFVVGGAFLTDAPAPEMPGVGTFQYFGSSIGSPAATVGRQAEGFPVRG
jgi:hypothetical protein